MERLRKVIEEYGRWSGLRIYTDRIDAHISVDFSHAVENAKALLETIAREICTSKGVEVEVTTSINSLLKKAFTAVGYTSDNMVTQISSALATIGQNIGELRNNIGIISHGKSLDEIKDRNKQVDELTREFLIDATEIIASFMIRTFENENPRVKADYAVEEPLYSECEDFNEFWDETYGEFEMGSYSYPASEILFNVDYKAYKSELSTYEESE